MNQSDLKKIISYNPDTGIFRWVVNRPPRGKMGDIAGYNSGHGYVKISIGGKKYYAHRLAFLWMNGSIPKEIDHKNQCGYDNRWKNLRAAEHSVNLSNVEGHSGVRLRNGKWEARFSCISLGRFVLKKDAEDAYKREKLLRGEVSSLDRLFGNYPVDVPEYEM